MSPRASEPSARVAEILSEDRDPRVLELPTALARGRYTVSRQAIIGVALIVALAVAVLGGRLVLARQEAVPQPVASVEAKGDRAAFAGEEGEESETPKASTPSPTAKPEVTVHVVGEVEHPGLVTLPGGSRVADAVKRVGGETSAADLTAVNLARPLVDGEQVVVPKPGEAPVAAAPPAAGAQGAASGGAGGPVNLNTADLATLETLPGVGPVLAQRIMDWRLEHGQFTAVEELGEVSGIGDKTYEQLAPKVTV